MSARHHRFVRVALGLSAHVYGVGVGLRNRYFDRAQTRRQAGVPVICVGNLTVGGTGKTPIVEWLARRLLGLGLQPAVVSRGYGGRAGRGPLLVSEGNGPTCSADVCGDEPYLLSSRLERTLVIVGSDRVAGARLAAQRGVDAVVLDDGFQHRRLARDLDIVLLDSGDPFGNDRLLPAGTLREPPSGLRRAGAIVITRSGAGQRWPAIERVVRRHNEHAPILRAGHRAVGFVDRSGRPVAPPQRALAFCGIGRPESFRRDLEQQGVELVAFLSYADHHAYSPAEIASLQRRAAVHGVAAVATEKDLARLDSWGDDPSLPTLSALRIEAEVFEPEPLFAAVRSVLRDGG